MSSPSAADRLSAFDLEASLSINGAALRIESVRDVIARVDSAAKPRMLVQGLFPEGDHAVVGGDPKVGKSWAASDLLVSIASGGRWFDARECTQGPVIAFLGEGGERKMIRRLRAVAAFKDVELDDLPIRLCFRAPHLSDKGHLAEIERELQREPAKLVLIEPLYLAARGAQRSQLNDMGAHLENVQHLTQQAGSALLVVDHYKKTGDEKGAKRLTGSGPFEWARVVITGDRMSLHVDPASRATTAVIRWDAIGDEIGDQSLRIRRQVWADDPDDLASRMGYTVEPLEDEATEDANGFSPAVNRVLSVLDAEAATSHTVRDVGDLVAMSGFPLKPRTIQNALKQLRDAGRATVDDAPVPQWRSTKGGPA